jgi:hypothetical protein
MKMAECSTVIVITFFQVFSSDRTFQQINQLVRMADDAVMGNRFRFMQIIIVY